MQETQAFLSIKPQSESVAHAYESIRKLVKEEDTNKVLMSVRPLFTDRESYLKALAVQAEAEQYPIFAALLYNKHQEEELLAGNTQAMKKKMINVGLSFFTGGLVCGLCIGWKLFR